jgi:tetratricopeptide (TPR) repeat protein
MLYPKNADVYDSYGEVCKMLGRIDLAILNYTKSLELDPQNNNAKEMLTELQKK